MLEQMSIEKLEESLKWRLPIDYRSFLLEFNGGVWRHQVQIAVSHPWFGNVELHPSICLGIISDRLFQHDDILYRRKRLREWQLPVLDTLVPIMDAATLPIFLESVGPKQGAIYYFDKTDVDTEIEPVHLIADSFTEFLEMLRPADESQYWQETLPVFQAAERGQLDEVEAYLADGGKVDIRNERGWTLLMCAVRNSWPKIVRRLVDAGADLAARDPRDWTPLHFAVNGNSLDSVKILTAAGADVRYRDRQNRSLAQIARDELHYRISYLFEPHD